jgi:hypothetical protein
MIYQQRPRHNRRPCSVEALIRDSSGRAHVKPRMVNSAPVHGPVPTPPASKSASKANPQPTGETQSTNHEEVSEKCEDYYNDPSHPLKHWLQHRDDPFARMVQESIQDAEVNSDILLSLEDLMSEYKEELLDESLTTLGLLV